MPVVPIYYGTDKVSFRGTYQAECGDSSAVVGKAWLNIVPTWGGVHIKATCLDGRGGVTIPQWQKDIPSNMMDGFEIPSGTRAVTVEGKTEAPTVILSVRVVEQAK